MEQRTIPHRKATAPIRGEGVKTAQKVDRVGLWGPCMPVKRFRFYLISLWRWNIPFAGHIYLATRFLLCFFFPSCFGLVYFCTLAVCCLQLNCEQTVKHLPTLIFRFGLRFFVFGALSIPPQRGQKSSKEKRENAGNAKNGPDFNKHVTQRSRRPVRLRMEYITCALRFRRSSDGWNGKQQQTTRPGLRPPRG